MSHGDWFRNTSWDPEIENAFFKKLARARDKCQYLRIQASTLASRCPEVALRLLDKYFALGEHFDIAQAHVDRATAFLHLNQLDSAILAYEAALAREGEPSKYANPSVSRIAVSSRQRASIPTFRQGNSSSGNTQESGDLSGGPLSLELCFCPHPVRTGRPLGGPGSRSTRVSGFV